MLVIEIKKQELEDITISSTRIRNALKEGNINEANLFLNYAYKVTGIVAHGDKIGKTIGYPTANIELDEAAKLIPQEGVYAVKCNIEGLQKDGMMYIGTRPSVQGVSHKQKIEVNIFDFDDTIYNKPIEVDIIGHIRNDEKFDSLEDLKSQLAMDKLDAINLLDSTAKTVTQPNRVCIAILNYNGEEYLESYLPQVLYSIL